MGLLVMILLMAALGREPIPIGHVPVQVGDHGTAEGTMREEGGEAHTLMGWETLAVADGRLDQVRITWTASEARGPDAEELTASKHVGTSIDLAADPETGFRRVADPATPDDLWGVEGVFANLLLTSPGPTSAWTQSPTA